MNGMLTVKSMIAGSAMMILASQVAAQGVITGVVREDSTQRPLGGAVAI